MNNVKSKSMKPFPISPRLDSQIKQIVLPSLASALLELGGVIVLSPGEEVDQPLDVYGVVQVGIGSSVITGGSFYCALHQLRLSSSLKITF